MVSFLRIGNFALWQKTLITTVMNTISTCGLQNPAETGFLKRSTYPVAAWRMNEP